MILFLASDVAIRAAAEPPDTLVGRNLSAIGVAIYAPAGHPAVSEPNGDLGAYDTVFVLKCPMENHENGTARLRRGRMAEP